jgi:predicted acyl esterase
MRFLPAVAAVVAALLFPATSLAEVPANADWFEAYIETPGEPTLHVDVMVPKGTKLETAKLPLIVSVGPYFGHAGESVPGSSIDNDGPQLRWADLIEGGKIFEKGYALVQVDLRGFGASAGCNDFGGRGEQTDVKRAVEWATSQPWSNGKAGLYGKSYDGWTGVMGLSEKPKGLAAAIIQSPIIDGYRTLYQNGVHYDYGWYATPALYQAIDANPPTPFDSPEYIAGAATGFNPACYGANIAQQNGTPDHDSATGFWKERDLPNARGADIPTLWSHGFNDANTKPDNFLPVYSTLTGPKRAWIGQFAHDRGNEAEKVGHAGFFDDVMAWLDRYVKGDTSVNPAAEPQIEVGSGDGRWRYEAQWPPTDVAGRTMAVKAGTFTDEPNTGSFGSGSDTWSITPPLASDARIAGTPRLAVDASSVSPRAHLVAQLFDIDAGGSATLMHRAAHVVEGAAGKLTFELYPNDWPVKAGHRIALRLTTDDFDWYTPPHSNAPVEVAGGTLEIPFLAFEREGFIASKETPSMGSRATLDVPAERMTADVVAFEQPQPLAARPAGTPQGAAPAPAAAQRAANRLTVSRRFFKGRRVRVVVKGAGASRVRITVRRGKKAVAKRVVRSRAGVARITFRLKKAGRYRFDARVLDGVSLSGSSKPLRVR